MNVLNFTKNKNANLLALGAILIILLLNMLLQAFFTWRSISDEQANRKRMETNVKNEKVDELKQRVEGIVTNSASAFEHQIDSPNEINHLLLSLLQNNEELLGSAVAYLPGYFEDKSRLYSPYAYHEDGSIRIKVLNYDYTTYEWYQLGMSSEKGGWTKPYVDGDATKAIMSTFALPLRNSEHKVVAVLTGDLPMSQLTTSDNMPYRSMSLRTLIILGMQALSLLIIVIIVFYAFRYRKKMEAVRKEKEHADYEMDMAQQIQKDILPYEQPQNDHLLVSAKLEPAEQVSGDFYDYRLYGDCLCFCIGDISTTGLGAAMAMLVTWTAYRSCTGSGDSLASVIRQMNNALTDINDQQMFATFFAGELNLRTGMLTYCNAGHLPPVLLTTEGEAKPLEVTPNVPLGIVEWNFEQQTLQLRPGDSLFLYTDGVIEAMNEQEGVFGEKKLALHLRNAALDKDHPEAIVKRITTALQHHIGVDRTCNDDMTMLAIQYL